MIGLERLGAVSLFFVAANDEASARYTSLWHKKSMLFNYEYGWYGGMILPTLMLFHNLSQFLLLVCFSTGFALNVFISAR